jgi:hypothetical protein
VTALREIGDEVLPELIEMLPGEDKALQYRIISIFWGLGPKARAAIPAIEALRRTPAWKTPQTLPGEKEVDQTFLPLLVARLRGESNTYAVLKAHPDRDVRLAAARRPRSPNMGEKERSFLIDMRDHDADPGVRAVVAETLRNADAAR